MIEPVWIEMDGTAYFGDVDIENNVLVGTRVSGTVPSVMKAYIKARNVNGLERVKFGDKSVISTRNMTPEEKIQYDAYESTMKLVKSTAVPRLENDYFDRSF